MDLEGKLSHCHLHSQFLEGTEAKCYSHQDHQHMVWAFGLITLLALAGEVLHIGSLYVR